MAVVSAILIYRILFDEDTGGDDIALRDFGLGVEACP